MKKIFVFIALFTAINAVAGPLGLSKGMTLEEVNKHGDFKPVTNETYMYRSSTLTNGHPDFELYTVVLTPQHGLCRISATGKDVNTNVYGDALKDKFSSLSVALSEKYGKPDSSFDYLKKGSIWNESQDWMISLHKNERVLSQYWIKKQTSLPDSLQAITLEANALSQSKGWVSLFYEFDNFKACLDSRRAKRNSNL